MRVKLQPRALQRARTIKIWWRRNRPGYEDVFEQELDRVTQALVAMSPRSPIGTIYRVNGRVTIRRVLLPTSEQHLYYSIDETRDMVIIRSLWGARRGRGPRL